MASVVVPVAQPLLLSNIETRRQRTAECARLATLAVEALHDEPWGLKTSAVAKKLGLEGRERAVAHILARQHPTVFRVNPGNKHEARYAHKRWVDNIAAWKGRTAEELLRN